MGSANSRNPELEKQGAGCKVGKVGLPRLPQNPTPKAESRVMVLNQGACIPQGMTGDVWRQLVGRDQGGRSYNAHRTASCPPKKDKESASLKSPYCPG